MSSPPNSQQRADLKLEQTDSIGQATVGSEQVKERNPGVPWYKVDIGPCLKPSTRNLYQTYSETVDDDIVTHLHSIFGEYPCVGEWLFLLPSVTALPGYQDVLLQVIAGASVLDLGCCFGQDLRRLAADRAPTENMYALDINPELWELGLDLFRDRKSMKARFIRADILDSSPELDDLKGQIDIVFMCQFLYLFDWGKQMEVIRRVAVLSKPGTWLMGYQIGRVTSEERPGPWGTMFFHNVDSFQNLWRKVEIETGFRWTVDVAMVDLEQWGMEKEDYEWMSANSKGLNFVAIREH